ncbi:DUF2790 domain-containing protein [Pseudomonas sp. DTU_2021_1001937_2_SI_NGA_ILE_001]|uniref:DUF2790 domain-containing protein n=1 Tax=Pseudomonas sp. DTU_2021_1001937_2_SI_NGA_ILE_001 TaxID=3077589 RepID=UPI0028FC25E6|nr:DUF2790 domain-containing protein [Pseudomonas sp. DTU_2021_1001937_2_SI_NGA_ILE_001]WNW09843.1 DUF2790 domain-containing protein [Pseudomonas sp. DTU_2021_1001937_2_SI_NGA_ILE_001]
MKTLKTLAAILVFGLPLAAQANSPEHVRPQGPQGWRGTVEHFAEQSGRPAPAITEYRYGMPLDVAKMHFQSPLDKSCQAVPRLMVYENSQGDLQAMRYQAMSGCRSNQ